MSKTKEVQVNERGRRIGESHPRAKLSDQEIDWIRELAEPELDGDGKVLRRGLGYREIAAKFEIHQQYVKRIVRCERRGQTPAGAKRVKA